MASKLLEYLKELYIKAKNNDFEWKPIYPNNMLRNGVEGQYCDMFFEHNGTYEYIKYSIEYKSRCDEKGTSHPDEGVKYYVLHSLVISDLKEKFVIPEPTAAFVEHDDSLSLLVNDYGRFRYVFDDEETAKSVVSHEMLRMIYPYLSILDEEEENEWSRFVNS